jgi:hemerythrin-like domain-containing protein
MLPPSIGIALAGAPGVPQPAGGLMQGKVLALRRRKIAFDSRGAAMPALKPHTDQSPRPPTPALGRLETLDHTHHEIVQAVACLRLLVEKIEVRGADEGVCRTARDICDFFDGTASAHHAEEEAHVFPELLTSDDPALVQAVRQLQSDHGWLEEDWLELAPQLRAVANGQSWYDLDELRASVSVFSELYLDHIRLEETIVYPASRYRLEMAARAARARTES